MSEEAFRGARKGAPKDATEQREELALPRLTKRRWGYIVWFFGLGSARNPSRAEVPEASRCVRHRCEIGPLS